MNREELKEKLNHAKPVDEETFNSALDITIDSSKTLNVNEEIIVAVEELSELQKELTKYIRGERDFTGVEEEMADVYIALGLIKKMLNIPQEEIDKKLIRLQVLRYQDILWKTLVIILIRKRIDK